MRLSNLVTFTLLALVSTLFAVEAFAQNPIAVPVTPAADAGAGVDQAELWVAAAAGLLVLAMNTISAFVPSVGRLMKIVDVFAFNWGKARNDPNAQTWKKAKK